MCGDFNRIEAAADIRVLTEVITAELDGGLIRIAKRNQISKSDRILKLTIYLELGEEKFRLVKFEMVTKFQEHTI